MTTTDKKRGMLERLLVKHGHYRTDSRGNVAGLSRKGAYTLIFMVLALGGSMGFLIWLSLEGKLQSNPLRYLFSIAAGIVLLGIVAALDYRLHPDGD